MTEQDTNESNFAGWLAVVSPDIAGDVANMYPDRLNDWAPLTKWPAPIVDWPDDKFAQ